MMVVGRLQAMMDAIEREAPECATSFGDVEALLGKLLEQKVVALAHAQDIYYLPGVPDAPRAPFVENEYPAMNRAVANILAQARALAFVQALLRGLRDREGELRQTAFPRGA